MSQTDNNASEQSSLFVYYQGFLKVFSKDILNFFTIEANFEALYRKKFTRITNNIIDFEEDRAWEIAKIKSPLSLLADYNEPSLGQRRYIEIAPLRQQPLVFPTASEAQEPDPGALRSLQDELISELQDLNKDSPGYNVGKVWRYLAQKYLSRIGIEVKLGGRIEPLPLYDVLRVTAAIIGLPEDNICLTALDVSGVQNFVYNINNRRALLSLRGRSIFLEMVSQIALREILRETGCGEDCLLVTGGGYYLLLLPSDRIAAAQDIIDRWNRRLWQWQEGRVYFAFGAAVSNELSLSEVARKSDRFTDALKEISERLSLAKQQKFNSQLSATDFKPSSFETKGEREAACYICRRHLAEKDLEDLEQKPDDDEPAKICDLCYFVIGLGREVTGANKVINLTLADNKIRWQLEGKEKRKLGLVGGTAPAPVKVVFNPRNARQVLQNDLVLWLPVADLDPHTAHLTDLSELASDAKGWPGLGTLRADVDSLGQLLKGGPKSQDGSELPLLVETVSISRLLSEFFSVYLDELRTGENSDQLSQYRLDEGGFTLSRRRNFLIVYGGGDDLFGVGAWDDALEFSLDLARLWRDFTGGNPGVTFSAGLSVTDAKYPIAALAKLSGDLLDQAKENFSGRDNDGQKVNPKDSFATNLARRPLYWDELSRVYVPQNGQSFHWLTSLYKLLSPPSPKLSRSFLRRLITIDATIHNFAAPGEKWQPGQTYRPSPQTKWEPGRTYRPSPQGKVDLLYLLASSNEFDQMGLTKPRDRDKNKDGEAVFNFLKSLHSDPQPPHLALYLNWLDLLLRKKLDEGLKDESTK